MKLVYALLCDQAFLSIDRKVNIIGVFETINAQTLPVTHYKFTLVGSVEPSSPKFKMAVDIVSEKSKTSILREPQEREVSLPAGQATQHFNFIIDILNTSFNEVGKYEVRLLIDGKVISELPLTVARTELVN